MLYSISIWVLCSLGQQLSKVLKLAPLQPSSFWLLLPVGLYRNVRIIDFESFSRNNKSEEVKLNIYPLSDCQALYILYKFTLIFIYIFISKIII